MSPERDDFQDDDERDEFASRSIFSAGWFRAVLVLTVLAIVVVISLPYLLNWFEPSPPPRVARPSEPAKAAPATAPPAVAPAPPAASAPVAPAPSTAPAPSEPKAATPPPAPALKAPEPKVAEKPAPAAPKTAEKPAPAEPARKAVAEKPAPKVAAEKPQPKAAPAKAVAEKAPEKASAKAVAEKPSAKADKAAPVRVAKAETPSRPVSTSAKSADPAGAAGKYWIQLGAFKEQKNADTLAQSLRDAGFPVQVSPITRSAAASEPKTTVQQHELFVTETNVDKVNASLKGRGTAQAVSGGVAVRPAFSLQEAMSVSKRLTDDGLKVVIRPAGGPAAAPAAAASTSTLHAVRVGGYPNRTSALAARDELSAKGHPGFLAEGPAK